MVLVSFEVEFLLHLEFQIVGSDPFFSKKMGHRGWNRSGILGCVNLDDVSGCSHIDNAVSHLKSTILEILGCSDVEKSSCQ